jgi:hypothetical protein
MEDKYINIIEEAKLESDEVLPIEKEEMLNQLRNIHNDIAIDYSIGVDMGFERLLFFKNFIVSRHNPKLSRLLLEQMDPTWFEDLRNLVFLLADKDVDEKVDEIINATMGRRVHGQSGS